MKKGFFVKILITCCMIGIAYPVVAETKTIPDDWRFTLTPFFLQGITIDRTSGNNPWSGSLSLNFSDEFLESNSQGQKIHLKAQKNGWTLFADYQYSEPDPSAEMLPLYEPIDLKAQITELGASYRFATWNNTDFEVLAGTRYKNQDESAALDVERQTGLVENDEWWRNTFVGLRFFSHISENWTFIGRGDIGAGAGGKNIAWNVAAVFDYRLEDWGSFYFGYKLLAFDYNNVETGMERYAYDALEQGPFIGLNIRW